jgi:hypothetical protein
VACEDGPERIVVANIEFPPHLLEAFALIRRGLSAGECHEHLVEVHLGSPDLTIQA